VIAANAIAGEESAWAREIGAFNGAVLAAAELENGADFDAGKMQQRLALSFVKSTVGVLATNPVGAVAAGVAGEGLTILTEPDARALVERNGTAEAASINATKAAIAAGYYAHDPIPGVPEAAVVHHPDGTTTLIAYDKLEGVALSDFNRWLSHDHENLGRVAGNAFLNASDGRDDVLEILLR
jgi:hypothetical protein